MGEEQVCGPIVPHSLEVASNPGRKPSYQDDQFLEPLNRSAEPCVLCRRGGLGFVAKWQLVHFHGLLRAGDQRAIEDESNGRWSIE